MDTGKSVDAAAATNGAADDADVVHWQLVKSAVALVQREIDAALEHAGIAPPWFAVLHHLLLADDHRLPMSRLAREVSMTTGGFTKLADRMAREGLIDRRGSADDRRVVHAALSADGLAMAGRAARVHARALQTSVLDSVSSADLAAVAATMGGLVALPAESGPEFVADDPAPADAPQRRRDDLS